MKWRSFQGLRKQNTSGRRTDTFAADTPPAGPSLGVPGDTSSLSPSSDLHSQAEASAASYRNDQTECRNYIVPELRVIDDDQSQLAGSSNKQLLPIGLLSTPPEMRLVESHSIRTSPQGSIYLPGPSEVTQTLNEASPRHERLHIQQAPNYLKPAGFFNGAHNFVMNYPTIVENVHISEKPSALKELALHTIPGVEFDSSARHPPPQCHPGTRVEIIDTVRSQIHQLRPGKRILWLYGPAGVGKSAIIQTVAEREAESGILGAALFFSRPNGRNNPSQMWTTISYQLATKDNSYQAYVQDQLARDPKMLEKSTTVQFKKLIAEPFGHGQVVKASQSLPILLDGLDECDGEEAQIEIIELVSEFAKKFPLAPLVWVIASRPEQHLKVTLEYNHVQEEVYPFHVPANSTQGCKDVESYLEAEFGIIRRRYPHSMPAVRWPKDSDMLTLTHAASGLFIFASAVIRFISDSKVGNPVSQLEIILSIAKETELSGGGRDPLSILHKLYTEILESVPKETYPTTKRILGLVLLFGRGFLTSRYMPFREMCNLLGLEQHVAYGALHRLHSVLQIPKPGKAETKKVTVFHASFSDYLGNRDASGDFWIDTNEIISELWGSSYRILHQANISADPFPCLSNITLKWHSSSSFVDQFVRKELWKAAQVDCFHQLLPCSDTKCPYRHIVDFSYPTRIIDIFQTINFTKIVSGYLSPGLSLSLIIDFVEWLAHEERPQFFQMDVLQDIAISNISDGRICRDMVSCRITDREMTTYTDSNLDESDRVFLELGDLRPVSELLIDLASHRSQVSVARLVGSGETGRCALLLADHESRSAVYYILPYSAGEQ